MTPDTLLARIEDDTTDILHLTGEVGEDEFFASRLTRGQALKLMKRIATSCGALPDAVREAMPELDWAGWAELGAALAEDREERAALWDAVQTLTPNTLQWLRVHREAQPHLFLPAE